MVEATLARTVKQGDKFPLVITVNYDLTGATTRLIVRHLSRRDGFLEELPHQKSGQRSVVHVLDGTWARGSHYLELEITHDGEIRTAPSKGALVIRVEPDLDH